MLMRKVVCARVTDSGGNRKREVSMSPAHGSGKKARTDAAVVDDADVEQIVVEGAGASDANGTYKRCQSYDSLSIHYDRNAPVYSKRGSWEGKAVKFFIHRSLCTKCWYIRYEKETGGYPTMLYISRLELVTNLPPKSYWGVISCTGGISPSPRLKW